MTDMYIASCDREGGIYHYKFDGKTVTEKQFYPLDRPTYMEIKNNRLYATLRDPKGTGESGVISFDLDSEGNLINESEIIYTKGR